MSRTHWLLIEQPAGPPSVKPVDPAPIEEHRRATYRSYETFLRRRLERLDRDRPSEWHRDYSSPRAYARSIGPMRKRLAQMLGFWQAPADRSALRIKRPEIILEQPDFRARRFRFEVLPGLETYAVELIPRQPGVHAGLLVQHGYTGTPELACGLTPSANAKDYSYRSLGLRAVQRGFHVLAVYHPSGYGSLADLVGSVPGFEKWGPTYGKNRLHRLAILGGGTLCGLDVMASSCGLDYLSRCRNVASDRLGIYGLSQGGQVALFLAALDQRLQATVCSAYFNTRRAKLIGPHRAAPYLDTPEEDKLFTQVFRWFGDADLVSMVAPRAFAVEAGRRDRSVDFETAASEFKRAAVHYRRLALPQQIEFIPHASGHISATRRAFEFLEEKLAR